MKKILLPTDFSDYSKVAIQYAFEWFGKAVYPDDVLFLLMHVYGTDHSTMIPSSPYMPASPVHLRDVMRVAERSMEKALADYRRRYPAQRIQKMLVEGGPVEAILDLAREEGADLIVMGTKGLGGLERAVLGSVTLGVTRAAPCPVLVVPEEAAFSRPEKVVFATDFRNLEDLHILDPLSHLVEAFDPQFMLLHIYSEMKTTATEKTQMNRLLRDYFHTRHYQHFFLKRDDPVAGVDEFVRGMDADLLVLVGQERNFFEQLFHKSLTKTMIIHSEIPVFVLHPVKAKKGGKSSAKESINS